jgi:hypothetical protein
MAQRRGYQCGQHPIVMPFELAASRGATWRCAGPA